MNNRERLRAIFNYEQYDRLPVVHFGYWSQLLEKWVAEGHLKAEQIQGVDDGTAAQIAISAELGFDFDYFTTYQDNSGFSSLWPAFEPRRIREFPDGSFEYFNEDGAIVLQKKDVCTIPAEIGHLLTDRVSWEEHYLPRLQYSDDRFNGAVLQKLALESTARTEPLGLYCKSLFGQIRNWMGIEGISYLYADDEDLYDEIINTVGELSYKLTERVLQSGIVFDFAHFWEDICFKNGPLVTPQVFEKKAGPHYRRICDLVRAHGIEIVSLDCDGVIDKLLPIWFENGVNTMFPIEVGTWHASIAPWREKYGRQLRGVGGMNKHVLSADKAAIDAEIERLKPLVDLGAFLPCPDHRLPPDTSWDLTKYYCERMRRVFG